jgi:D-hexose-6-phosphate mutarotase
MKFTTLLHTYIRVGDIRNTSVKGFKGKQYKTENEATPGTFTDDREIATFQCETDRIYTDCDSQEIEIDEQGGRPGGKMTVLNSEEKNEFDEIVLWNPAEERAKGMADLGEGEW